MSMIRMVKMGIYVILLFLSVSSKAQTAYGYDCLGTLCYVNVYINTDFKEDGFLKYTIPTPSESIYDSYSISGPGSPYLSNYLGDSVDLFLRYSHLYVEADGKNCELSLMLYVKKWVSGAGIYTTTEPALDDNTKVQCYYYVKLNIIQ